LIRQVTLPRGSVTCLLLFARKEMAEIAICFA